MNFGKTISVLFALDDAHRDGRERVSAWSLSGCTGRDTDLLFELLERLCEAGWIAVEPETELVPHTTVSLKRSLETISVYALLTLFHAQPQSRDFIKPILRDISMLDLKTAKEEFENAPKDREYDERMLRDLERRIAAREFQRRRMEIVN